MKKLIFTFLGCAALFMFSTMNVKAQDYKNAIGGRFGSANGVSFKTALNKGAMLELIGNFRSSKGVNYINLTGLYEVYNPIKGAPGLNWFYGGGASIGSYKVKGYDSDIYVSLDGVLGLDYKFKGAPINLSLDWIPTLQLTPDTDFYSGDIGLGVRFTF
ncbi:hypothetical protein [Pedobacter punctiformis]|uniref:Outer membrane insertion C-signal n=1 Tax=Pedobacter punctiformis TaxID=3004097 RepID=A0ABT4LBF4_9SPHI|nr:hypothetical protein [Pedobacter sp. HCMS5-2]MCZ4245245.1 hypothetical protein [Pedobacter sp. HCMS5-2]